METKINSENEIIESAKSIAEDMINTYEKNKDDEYYLVEGVYSGESYICIYYGNILDIQPSGKFYTMWTTNQSNEDESNDSLFWETVNKIISEKFLWVESGQGDGCDIMICGMIPGEEKR